MTSIYDVWVMNLEGSWTKVLSVQPQIVAHWPLGVWEEDKMILEITKLHSWYYMTPQQDKL
ncbi:hypothetical protein H5410_023401 [Solanum commersonii]|uniref:F-box associated domain-containing protein n=1 Tax=Solanum commersonii TaxID=4109 RepID=A0A9J5ZJ90_SOLCO|nr:hypothetical protein H5410_023401 [Solanum commersonii]